MKVKSESEVAQSCPTLSDPMDCAYQAPPSIGFSRQEYWSGVPLPSPYPSPRPYLISSRFGIIIDYMTLVYSLTFIDSHPMHSKYIH